MEPIDDSDSFEFAVPEEIESWIEFQKQRGYNSEKRNLGYYVLHNGKIKKADKIEFATWLSDINNRRIDYTEISEDCTVSTIFLGLDHNFSQFDNRPIFYESAILGGAKSINNLIWRYRTLTEAKKSHWEIVDALRRGIKPCPNGKQSIFNFFKDFP